MKKFLSVICIFLLITVFCSGCAKTSYSLIVNADGSVEQGFQVIVDKQKIEDAGYTYQEVKNLIEDKFEIILSNQVSNIAYYCIENGIDPSKSGIECKYNEITEYNFYANIHFDSIEIFKDYQNFIKQHSGGSETEEEIEDKVENYVFFEKTISETTTVYYKVYEDAFVKDLLKYFDGTNGDMFDLTNVEYNFFYGLPTNKLHSEDSEVIYQNGVKIHHWQFDAETMDNPIITFTIQFKPAIWYAVAIVVSLLVAGVIGIVIFVQKKSKKVKNTIVNEQI